MMLVGMAGGLALTGPALTMLTFSVGTFTASSVVFTVGGRGTCDMALANKVSSETSVCPKFFIESSLSFLFDLTY